MTNEERLKAAEDAEKRGDYSQAELLLHEFAEAEATQLERASAMRIRGSVATRGGNYSLALENLDAALAISVSVNDRLGEAKTRNALGTLRKNLADYPEALDNYSRALNIHKELGDRSGMAVCAGNIGTVHSALCNYPKALEYYIDALSVHNELGDSSGAAIVTGNIGSVHAKMSDFSTALQYMSRALSMHEELGDMPRVASVIANIGNVYLSHADYPKALEYMSRSLVLREELGDKRGAAFDIGTIGAVHLNLADYSKALEYMSRALAIYEELGDKSGVAYGYGSIGNVHEAISDHPKALEYYSRALSMYEELGEKSGAATATGNIGVVYSHLSNYPKALEYISRGLAMHQELGQPWGVALATGNIGEVYRSQGDLSSALRYFEQALKLAQGIGERRLCASWLKGIGSTYTALKEYDKAREYLHRALELRRTELGTNDGVAEILIEFGRVALEEHNADEAAAVLEEARTLAHELGEKAQGYQAHDGLARAYELIGNFVLAYQHYKLFHSLKEEVQSEEARKKAEHIEQQRLVAEMERRQVAERGAAEATTTLLHKVLPFQVAERLLNGERVADYFPMISILFVDIVGFTPIAARMPAKAVLAFLNYVFGEFDRVMKKHGVQKIKTMGDGYMAVSGAPVECSDHAERLASAALELMADIQLPDDIRKTLPKGSVFHLRMGLHTGSAFAGIVGDEGFVYDVYSDAVNLAARMESSGEPGKIHCSEDFAYHLQNRDESFVFQERGEIEVKGKGLMRTYFLERV